MSYRISYACISHTGNYRRCNQDNFICDHRYMKSNNNGTPIPLHGHVSCEETPWFGVFDGMGGEEKGEVAAYLAARTAFEMKNTDLAKTSILSKMGLYQQKALDQFCREANNRICAYTVEQTIDSMGTTVALLSFAKKEVHLCNIGDSQVFQFRNEHLKQMSKDHVVQTAGSAKSVLYQNLGIPESEMVIEPYLAKEKIKDGDVYLICSDGLTDMLTVEEIEETLCKVKFDDAVSGLLTQALVRGGKDNITLILCKVEKTRTFFMRKKRQKLGGIL